MSTTKRSTGSSAGTCCRNGLTWSTPGPKEEGTRQRFSRRPCSWSRRRLLSHRPRLPQPHVRGGSSLDYGRVGGASALLDPTFDFGEIPYYASCCEVKAPWKLAALLHFVNGRVCKRHYSPQFRAPNSSPEVLRLLCAGRPRHPAVIPFERRRLTVGAILIFPQRRPCTSWRRPSRHAVSPSQIFLKDGPRERCK